MKKNKKTRLQRRNEQIMQRDLVIKVLVAIIAKNNIGMPMKIFNVIKDMFNIDIVLDPKKTKEQNEILQKQFKKQKQSGNVIDITPESKEVKDKKIIEKKEIKTS